MMATNQRNEVHDVISEKDDGKLGFLMALAALIVLMGSFGAMALRGSSDTLLTVMVCAMGFAVIGHFLLGGAEYRKEMIAKKKTKK